MGNEQGKLHGIPTPAGIQSMDESLQKKFAKGIQYNMKIVIRGDRNTGKTTLFHRMEGKPFSEAYLPTYEIQVTSILWSYRVTNDTVKVEIWDVVDKGRVQKSRGSKGILKMFNSPDAAEEEESGRTLDASFLDVYKGAHGVVFTFDITKQWTWKYIERELPRVPLHIPVIILASFMDLSEHRLITKEDCFALVGVLDRPEGAADIRYAECSMKNGFGLMHLHKFLSVPFLQLQQETLLQQLQVNREQMLVAMEELDAARVSEDQNYGLYLAKIQQMAEEKKLKSRQQLQESLGEEGTATPIRRNTLERTGPTASATPPRSHQATPAADPVPPTSQPSPSSTKPRPLTSPTSGGSKLQKTGSISSKFSSRFAGFLGKGKEATKKEEVPTEEAPTPKPKVVRNDNIEEFVPEGSADDFLESDDEEGEEEGEQEEDSDEDSDVGNRMIAADEDLSSPDEPDYAAPRSANKVTYTMDQSESDEEEEEEEEAPSILTPIKAPSPHKFPRKPKATHIPLKSALDIELTESEEEDAPVVAEDEDSPSTKSRGFSSASKPQYNGKSQKLEDIFEPPRSTGKKKDENKGLMMQFAAAEKQSPASAKAPKVSKDADTPTEESPDQRRREKKKKRAKRRKEDVTVTGVSSAGGQEVGGGEEAAAARNERTGSLSGNPYSAIASLDAWLNSDDTVGMGDFLTPTKVTAEVGEEGVESTEGQQSKKSTKKHKHKKHSERAEGEEGVARRKKHRSHHKSSRHRSIDQGD